jgi:poly-gamma-glutamate capsule biosynthesis protein CapA/YwtB (metallophosphatase superfamily)
MWALNHYWRILQMDGGLYVGCEALVLSRRTPVLLDWIAPPLIARVARGSPDEDDPRHHSHHEFSRCCFRSSMMTTIFLCGDVMTGRGVDQILPHPSNPKLHEPYVESSLEYLAMAEKANGAIPRPVDFSYIWGEAAEELDRAAPAARIINLETSITASEDYEPKGINYRMHPANAGCLSAAKIDCCVLANNHVLDWGRAGLAETISTLRKAGIQSTGAGRNLTEAWAHGVIEVSGNSRILVFGAGMTDSGIEHDWAATDSRAGVALLPDLSSRTVMYVAGQVRRVKRPGDIAVLSIHWGGNWGCDIPRRQQTFAHQVVDLAAVDMVHGHSSHHPKGIEVYRGKPILYGCGDFINDYEGIAGHEEFRSHLVLAYFVTMDFATGELARLEMSPFETKRFQLCQTGPKDTEWLQDMLSREGRPFGTRVRLETGGRLKLEWQK